MAAAIPLVMTFISAGSVAAGVATIGAGLAGAAGIAGFLSAGGAVLGAIGAISGSKDLSKVGMLMSLGGAVGSAFGGAASSAASSATGGADTATSNAWANGAGRGLDTVEALSGGAAGTNAALGSSLMDTSTWAMQAPSLDATSLQYAQDAGQSMQLGQAPTGFDGGMGITDSGSIMNRLNSGDLASFGDGVTTSAASPLGEATQSMSAPKPDTLTKEGGGMTMKEIVKAAGGKLEKLPEWIQKNKELVAMGGNVLSSMYGPQAEQLDWQRSIYDRRLKNLNSPIRLGIRTPSMMMEGG